MAKRQYNVSTGRVAALPRSERLRGLGATVSGGGSVVSSAVDISGKLDKVTFDMMFERVVTGTDEDGNEEWYIRAKRNLLGTGEISAWSGDGKVGTALRLGDLADVDAAGAEDGMALVYRGGRWVPGAMAAGGMDESALSGYLTEHEYLTRSALGGYVKCAFGSPTYRWEWGASLTHVLGVGSNDSSVIKVYNGDAIRNFANAVNRAGDTMTGNLHFSNADSYVGGNNSKGAYLQYKLQYLAVTDGGLNHNGKTIWDEGNDGHNSGLDADLLDGYHEESFFRSGRGYVPAEYIDLTDYNKGAAGYANYPAGTYAVQRSGYSELFVNLAINRNSTSALQFRSIFADNSDLLYRKTVDGNRVSGPWRKIITEINIGSHNAGSATRLQTARSLWGNSFDGSGDLTGTLVTTVPTGSDNGLKTRGAAYELFFGIGSGGVNRGIYDTTADRWWIYRDSAQHTYILGSNVGINTTSPAYALDVNGQIRAAGWLRQTGDAGWYNETYGGGMCMYDSVWVRTYNNKSLYSGAGAIRSDGYFVRDVVTGYSWNLGAGAYGVAIVNNSNQTPLLVGYRYGQSPAATGANRLFAMELLNNGTLLRFCFGGTHKVEMYSTGNMLVRGEITAYNTSDARLKRNIRPVKSAIELLRSLGGYYTYDYIPSVSEEIKHGRIGLIYQHISGHMAELMATEREDGYGALNYLRTDYINLIGATVLEVDDKVERLTARVRELEAELQRYKRA